jgi:putative hydrolase of the HAD superfamily
MSWWPMLINLSTTVVVFDLDDTLYSEATYVDSGLHHVCKQINLLYGVNIYSAIKDYYENNKKEDWLERVCELIGAKSSVKESLLWMYRLHFPNICLSVNCSEALRKIKSMSLAVAVLTDGRAVTQKLKLSALGLADFPTYISEDYGSLKPSPNRFKAIQKDYPAEHYIYVADNVQKDFLGCNPLGWVSIGMRGDEHNIYSQAIQGLPERALPDFWVNNWEELTELLLNS